MYIIKPLDPNSLKILKYLYDNRKLFTYQELINKKVIKSKFDLTQLDVEKLIDTKFYRDAKIDSFIDPDILIIEEHDSCIINKKGIYYCENS